MQLVMNQRPFTEFPVTMKSKNLLLTIACDLSLASGLWAEVTPYTTDANTTLLYHFDELR